MTNWIKDCFWSWANAIYFRFDKYEYDMDRCAFFEELNSGWHQMQDEWAFEQYWGKGAKPETIVLPEKDFDALVERLNQPPEYNENLAKLFQRKAPWEE